MSKGSGRPGTTKSSPNLPSLTRPGEQGFWFLCVRVLDLSLRVRLSSRVKVRTGPLLVQAAQGHFQLSQPDGKSAISPRRDLPALFLLCGAVPAALSAQPMARWTACHGEAASTHRGAGEGGTCRWLRDRGGVLGPSHRRTPVLCIWRGSP